MIKTVAILMLLITPAFALSEEVPNPPEGFRWVDLEEVKAAILMPESWHFKDASTDRLLQYFFSKETVENGGLFLTGLTLHVRPGFAENRDFTAVQAADYFIREIVKNTEIVTNPWRRKFRAFESFGVVTLNKEPKLGDYTTLRLSIANNRTGTLYLFTCESPVENWDDIEEVCNTILEKIYLEDEV